MSEMPKNEDEQTILLVAQAIAEADGETWQDLVDNGSLIGITAYEYVMFARAAIDAYNALPSQVAMREEIAELTAERDRLNNELRVAEFALVSKGYRKSCDIPACNCGDQWSHGGHAMERLREISDVLTENDVHRNGETILSDVICVIRERDRLRAAIDEAPHDEFECAWVKAFRRWQSGPQDKHDAPKEQDHCTCWKRNLIK